MCLLIVLEKSLVNSMSNSLWCIMQKKYTFSKGYKFSLYKYKPAIIVIEICRFIDSDI